MNPSLSFQNSIHSCKRCSASHLARLWNSPSLPLSPSLASAETFLDCHSASVPMWLSGFWLMSSVECKFCSRGLTATRWPLSWKGREDGAEADFSGDDERNAEAAPPLAISWTSNMPGFALMRVWGQCQAGRGILHPLIFKARALSRAAHGSTGLLPDIQRVAHTAAFTLKCRRDARYRSLPVFTFWLRACLYLCVSGRWKLPPRLWEGTLMFTQTTTLGSSAMSSKTQALFVTSNLSRTTSGSTLVCCLLARKEKPGP